MDKVFLLSAALLRGHSTVSLISHKLIKYWLHAALQKATTVQLRPEGLLKSCCGAGQAVLNLSRCGRDWLARSEVWKTLFPIFWNYLRGQRPACDLSPRTVAELEQPPAIRLKGFTSIWLQRQSSQWVLLAFSVIADKRKWLRNYSN